MSDQCLGEIRMFGGTYAPADWELCDGRLMSVAEHYSLFELIGTRFGGDGVKNFALPDLRGRLPIGEGTSAAKTVYTLGQMGGVEAVSLTVEQTPNHTHALVPSEASAPPDDSSGKLAAHTLNTHSGNDQDASYLKAGSRVPNTFALGTRGLAPAGGDRNQNGSAQPHPNVMPCRAITFMISLTGYYPSDWR